MEQWERRDTTNQGSCLTCGVCGKRAVVTEDVLDRWHPEVWAEYDDGTTEEVSPVCDEHEVTWDQVTGVEVVQLPRRAAGEEPPTK